MRARNLIIPSLFLLALGLLAVPGATALAPSAFHEDFESGGAGWACSTASMTLVTGVGAPDFETAHQYTTTTSGGDCFGPTFTVPAGTYCVSAFIRWDSGGQPFLGVDGGNNWIIGQPNYAGTFGVVEPVEPSTVGWKWYGKDVTLSAGNHQIMTELWGGGSKGGANLGYFDGIDVSEIPCSSQSLPLPELGTLVLMVAGLAGVAGIALVRRK